MIDLHTHLLPAIDDGSPSIGVSLDMLDAFAGMGFHTVLATPHLTAPLAPTYHGAVEAALGRIAAQARDRGITLLSGFEIQLTPDLPERLRQGEPVTLGTSRVVLVDLPFIGWPQHVDATLFEIQTEGFLPILAHPERYPDIQADPTRGLELAQRGIALQVTIGSFGGIFGRRAKRAAEELLALGAVHLVATDAHSAGHRMAAVPAGLRRLEQLVGHDGLQQLTLHGPKLLLDESALPPAVTTPIRRSRNPMRRLFPGLG